MDEGWLSKPIWGRGFRPFFLLLALYAALSVGAWVAVLAGWLPAPGWLTAPLWHGHEMIFGMVVAAAAGFLLTSVPVWTGTEAVAGPRLAALVALWLVGRLAMNASGALPLPAVAVLDLAFLPTLAFVLGRRVFTAGQRRNWGIVGILLVLFGINLTMHAQAQGLTRSGAAPALRVAVDMIIVLIVVIGGRITPSFTANALRRGGSDAGVRSHPWVDRLAIGAVVAVALTDVVATRGVLTGSVAALAAAALIARMAGWQSVRTGHDPLLWSLHVGYAWVPVGLLLVASADLFQTAPSSAAMHALTAGAMGGMILAVMTRVGLGHTGRPLTAPPTAIAAYVLVNAGALVRTAGPILWPAAYLDIHQLAAALWAGAFLVYAVGYGPMLLARRVDGKPG